MARREALEYGMLMICTSGLTAGLGLMLYMRNTPEGLEKVDLDAPFDFKGALNELSNLRDRVLGGAQIGGSDTGVKNGDSSKGQQGAPRDINK